MPVCGNGGYQHTTRLNHVSTSMMEYQEMNTERRTTTIDEAAQVLGISRNSAYAAAKRGEIPTVKIGRLLLVPITALDRLLSGATRPAQ
jgi:excisionase family DNA binding protein